ncbi:MAG: hypothetical protein ACYC9O_01795 [Candidatus Latescibacterota bacterium]
MEKKNNTGEHTSRREALGTVGKFVLPTIVTFSMGDLIVKASGTSMKGSFKMDKDNPGWGDGKGGGKNKKGKKR